MAKLHYTNNLANKVVSGAPDTNLLWNLLAVKLHWANLLANLLGSGKTSANKLYSLLGVGLARAKHVRW
jgi:hypothetical protein